MKQSSRSIDPRTRAGHITLTPEDAEDMWHIFNILHIQDRIRASTLRKVINESGTGTTEAKKIKITLAIEVEGTMFDATGGGVRCSGKTVEENKNVRVRMTRT
jgi:protein pelota